MSLNKTSVELFQVCKDKHFLEKIKESCSYDFHSI